MAIRVENGDRPENELRYRVKGLRPIDPDDQHQLKVVRGMLRDPKNARHLLGVPDDLDELAKYYRDAVTGYVAINELDETVATGSLQPPGKLSAVTRTYNANFERFCVRPEYQRHRQVGKQTALFLFNKGFNPQEEGGFAYPVIDLGLIVGPKDWEHAYRLFYEFGVRFGTPFHTWAMGSGGEMQQHMVIPGQINREEYFHRRPSLVESLRQPA